MRVAVLLVGVPWVVSAFWGLLSPAIGFDPAYAIYADRVELVSAGIIVLAITVGWYRFSLAQRYPESTLAQIVALASFLDAAWRLHGLTAVSHSLHF